MQDNRFMNTATATAVGTDVGLRAYMLGVYNHMTTALLLTGFFAYATKWAVLNVAGLGQLMYGTPLKWLVMLAPLGTLASGTGASPGGTGTASGGTSPRPRDDAWTDPQHATLPARLV